MTTPAAPDHAGTAGPPPAPAGAPSPEVRREFAGTGVFRSIAVLIVAGALLVIFFAQNNDPVDFEFLFFSGRPSMSFVLAATALVSAFITEAVAALWRKRRRLARTEHEELERLRASRIG